MRVILTGQALLQSDIRKEWPDTVGNMRPLLDGDVVFTNFETMIVEPGGSLAHLPDDNTGHHGPPEMLDALKEMGFNLLAMSNNHSYDLRDRGIGNLLRECKLRNLANAGVGLDLKQAAAPAFLDTPAGRAALVSMATGLIRDGGTATSTNAGVNVLALEGEIPGVKAGRPMANDAHRILESIASARRQADIVIAYHHNHSYDKNFVELIRDRLPERLLPPQWVKDWAHQQVDAGADIVVSHGLPLVQGLEIYRGRPIFYNLGNLMFQLNVIFKDLFEPDVFKSVVAQLDFGDKGLRSIEFRPIILDDAVCEEHDFFVGMPKPAPATAAKGILHQLSVLSKEMGVDLELHDEVARVTF